MAFAAPGIPVPFVAGVIDCDGTSVRGNVINTEPDPEHVTARHEGQAGDATRSAPTTTAPRPSASASSPLEGEADGCDDIWILGIHMTKFGKHPDNDIVDLAAEAAMAALEGRRRRR